MTISRSFIAFLLLAGSAVVTARAADVMPDHHADHVHTHVATQKQILSGYETVRTALADDDLSAARTAAQKLATAEVRLHHAAIANSAKDIAKADDLAAARAAFKILSNETIALARQQKGYFILTCPMVQADWVQSTREVANPYLGRDMLTCGTVKAETKG
jgi:hypothetical protein